MSTVTAPALAPAPAPVARHSAVEDVVGLLTGTFLAAFGLFLLKAGGAVTGGTAGIALLFSYLGGAGSFGAIYFVVNLPFLALGWWRKGRTFALRTLACMAMVSGFALLIPVAVPALQVQPLFAVLAGNLLAGVGMLITFRHRGSLGGLNVVALLAQERLGWRAGYVQLAFDAVIIATSLLVLPPAQAVLSAAGAVVLNVVLALNHRPGRYLG